MEDNVKVSVIVPIYNVEKYIRECVESVLKQTLKEIEIICVNDGTPDGSMSIVEELSKADERIVIVNKENRGLSSARNAGLQHAKGEFIHFLDSDDYLIPEALEELYGYVKEKRLDNIYFDAHSFFETEEIHQAQKSYETYYQRNASYDSVYSGTEIFVEMRKNKDFKPSACLQMPKRSLLLENQISFYEGILHEDNLFSLQVVSVEKRVMHVKKDYYMRRVHENSIMTTGKGIRNAYGYFVCNQEILRFMENKVMSDEFMEFMEEYLINLHYSAIHSLAHITKKEILEELAEIPANQKIGFGLWVYGEMVRQNGIRSAAQAENRKLRNEIGALRAEVEDYKTSESYRVGKIITYIPRRIYGIARLLKEKGIHYAWYRFGLKLTRNRVRVSVIIPVYNASKYLRICLDTILNQTLSQIEVICVNDGSTDESLQILEEYQKRDKRVVIINQENSGAGAARNNGIAHAKGEYLLFLDADDTFFPELCNLIYYQSKRNKAQVCLFPAERHDMQTGKFEPMGWVFRENEIPDGVFSAGDIKDKIYQVTTGCPWSKLFSHKFVLENNLQFQSLKNANDVLFVRTACALADRITSVKGQPLVTYRYNDGDNTQSQKKKAPIEFYKAFKALKEQLKARGRFELVEQSYVNMVVTESLFNLRTAGTEEARQVVKKTLLEEAFPFFELEKFEIEYFYNPDNYKEYCKLLEENVIEKSSEGDTLNG